MLPLLTPSQFTINQVADARLTFLTRMTATELCVLTDFYKPLTSLFIVAR